MDIASLDADHPVVQYYYSGAAPVNDEWLITSVGGGEYKIQNRASGLYLTAPDGNIYTQFVQSAWTNGDNQKFTFVS